MSNTYPVIAEYSKFARHIEFEITFRDAKSFSVKMWLFTRLFRLLIWVFGFGGVEFKRGMNTGKDSE